MYFNRDYWLNKMIIRYINISAFAALTVLTVGCGDSQPPKVVLAQPVQNARPTTVLPSSIVEISLSQPVLPSYVVVSGLADAESWGRWSTADRVVFKFGSNLPKKFALVFSAKAYGPNAGLAIPVKSGGQVREMTLSAEANKSIRLVFLLDSDTDTVEIGIPKPTVPSNGDVRALGIAISTVKIEPL